MRGKVIFLFLCGIGCVKGQEKNNVVFHGNIAPQDLSARVEAGRKEFDKWVQQSKMPSGECWKEAIEALQESCGNMGQDQQSRLALMFTACYNEMLGFPSLICESVMPLKVCMSRMDESTRATFRDFFFHTKDMCYYLAQELWRERTAETMGHMTSAMVDVNRNIQESKEKQVEVLEKQQETLKVQSEIVQDNHKIHGMMTGVKETFTDIRQWAQEQRTVVYELFDRLSHMQRLVSWMQGRMSLLDTLSFYFASILFGHFCTATEKTQGARFPIILLILCTMAFERFFYNKLSEDETKRPEDIQEWVWICRQVACLLGFIIIIVSAAFHRSANEVQLELIAKFEALANEIKSLRENMGQTLPLPAAITNDRGNDTDGNNTTGEDTDEGVGSGAAVNRSSSGSGTGSGGSSDDTIPEEDTENEPPATAMRSPRGRMIRQSGQPAVVPNAQIIPNPNRRTYSLRERKPSGQVNSPRAITSPPPQTQTNSRKSNRRSNYYSSDED